jgi:hypothetical protein
MRAADPGRADSAPEMELDPLLAADLSRSTPPPACSDPARAAPRSSHASRPARPDSRY